MIPVRGEFTHARTIGLQPAVQRVPVEVWQQIFRYLYPSQLSRMSLVDKKLHAIVYSLEVWSRMFVAAQGSKAQLRPLVGIPKSQSYMIFMCALSLHVCERCFHLEGYNARYLYKLPLPIPVLLPRRSTETIKYLGEKYNPDFHVRMCLACRQSHIQNTEEILSLSVQRRQIMGRKIQRLYPCASRVPELSNMMSRSQTVDEKEVVCILRAYFGGDVGVEAYGQSTEDYDERTEARVLSYQYRE